MRTNVSLALISIVALVSLISCGDDTTAPEGETSSEDIRATINGVPWISDMTFVLSFEGIPGLISIIGSEIASDDARNLSLQIGFVEGPGTYPVGVGTASTKGASGIVVIPVGGEAVGFRTRLTGDDGTAEILSLGDGRIQGTFSFVAPTDEEGVNPVDVTSGSFDIAIPDDFIVVSGDDRGSTMTATLGGVVWNGATIVGRTSEGFSSFSASTESWSLTLSNNDGVPIEPGEYDWSSDFTISIEDTKGGSWTSDSASPGGVTIDTWTGTRAVGTVHGTFDSIDGTADPLVVSDGTFDIQQNR